VAAVLPFTLPTTIPAGSRITELDGIETNVGNWRDQLMFLRKAKPIITFYRNREDGDSGLEYYGRVAYQDTIKASFPFKKNVSAQGVMELRYDHYISEWLRSIPNDPEHKKNIVIRVDFFGGKLRWTGLLHHHAVKMRDGIHYMELTFNDDLQFLQFLLGPPNPALPIPIFQWPRVLPVLVCAPLGNWGGADQVRLGASKMGVFRYDSDESYSRPRINQHTGRSFRSKPVGRNDRQPLDESSSTHQVQPTAFR
jgi:hypothetical protein